MSEFVHERHKPLTKLVRPRPLVVACAPLRSNVNLSRIVRAASCSGVGRVIACGTAKIIGKIARDGADTIDVEVHRTLAPVLKQLKAEGYHLVGLEQTTGSQNLHGFAFQRQSVLVVGNERAGLRRRVGGAGCRGRDSRLWAAVQLQRGHRHGDGDVEYCRQYPAGSAPVALSTAAAGPVWPW